MCNYVEINILQRIFIADKTYNIKFLEIKLTNWLEKNINIVSIKRKIYN